MSKKYQNKLKRLWQISLAESVKVYVVAIIGWIVLFVLSRLLNNIGMNNLQIALKFFYIILVVVLIILTARPIAKTLLKTNYVAAVWMFIFMIINLSIIGIILLWLSLIFTDFKSIFYLIKGPFNVTIYLS